MCRPYKIINRCGETAYKLDLPAHSKVHPMFNASQLKLMVGSALTSTYFSRESCDVLVKEQECVLDMKMVKRQGRAAVLFFGKIESCSYDSG